MQRLFSTAKVGVFLDGYRPATEKRKSGDVPVLKLTLRVAPFDAKLAGSVDDGVGEESNVRATLFRLSNPDPKPHLDRVNFALGCARQNVTLYASPDTEDARLTLAQCKVSGSYARTQKDENGFQFVFSLAFGPVGREELEFVHGWYLTQRFATFEASEPLIEYGDDGDDEDPSDADEKARDEAPMWDDGDGPEPARRTPRRHPGKGKAR